MAEASVNFRAAIATAVLLAARLKKVKSANLIEK
jgi:hypothetical protein